MHSEHILVPLITPLNNRKDVCEESVVNLMNQARDYALGVVPCLTSGEGWRLTLRQWSDMVRYCVNNAFGLKVVAGVEKATTDEVLHFSKLAGSLDADGVMLTTPFGNGVSQSDMVDHYRKIHDNSTLEIWIYHEQALSNNLLTLEGLLTVSRLSRVVGVKDSGPDDTLVEAVERFAELGVNIYHGWEDRLIGHGNVTGNIVSLSNLEPAICQQAALSATDFNLRPRIEALIEKYELTAEDWYRHVKNELYNRGVITSRHISGEHPLKGVT